MVARSDKSTTITPSTKSVPRVVHFEADTFPAVLAVSDLLFAGNRIAFAESALIDALYDIGVLNAPRAPLLPHAETLKTAAEQDAAFADVITLMTAMANRLATQTRSPFFLREATLAYAKRAFAYPAAKPFAWPVPPARREIDAVKPLQLKVSLHPRLEMALDQWQSELKEESARGGRAHALQRAVRMKLSNLGVNPVDFFKDPKLTFRRPRFVRYPHADATFENRALEERFLAILQALETLHGAGARVPGGFGAAANRLLQLAEAAGRVE